MLVALILGLFLCRLIRAPTTKNMLPKTQESVLTWIKTRPDSLINGVTLTLSPSNCPDSGVGWDFTPSASHSQQGARHVHRIRDKMHTRAP